MVRPPKPKYEVIEKTLNKITKKQKTKATYRSYINLYFKLLDIKDIDNYFNFDRDYTKDIWKAAENIENMPPKTQSIFITVLKRFLTRNGVEIKQMEWEDIASRNELNRAYKISNDVIPTGNQLKRLLHFADPKIKTLVLFLTSTGCRINEALNLTWNDIDLKDRRVNISAEISKTSRPRYTFFTEETKELLETWKQERSRFLTNAMNKSIYTRNRLETQGFTIKREGNKFKIYKDGKKIDKKEIIDLDQRIFPFTAQTAKVSWSSLLEKAGKPFNEKDNNPRLKNPRYRYHFHGLRKFWFHSFQNTDANKNHIDFMGGHQTVLDATYTNFYEHPEKLKPTYDKHSGCLLISETQPDVSDIQEALEEKDKTIREMQKQIDKLQDQYGDLLHKLVVKKKG